MKTKNRRRLEILSEEEDRKPKKLFTNDQAKIIAVLTVELDCYIGDDLSFKQLDDLYTGDNASLAKLEKALRKLKR